MVEARRKRAWGLPSSRSQGTAQSGEGREGKNYVNDFVRFACLLHKKGELPEPAFDESSLLQ